MKEGVSKMFNVTRRTFLQQTSAGLTATAFGSTRLFAQDGVLKIGVVHQGPISDAGWE
jgi:basic membrane protein A and related proteins